MPNTTRRLLSGDRLELAESWARKYGSRYRRSSRAAEGRRNHAYMVNDARDYRAKGWLSADEADQGDDEVEAARERIAVPFLAHLRSVVRLRRLSPGMLELEIEHQAGDHLEASLIHGEEARSQPVAFHPERRSRIETKIYPAACHPCKRRVISKHARSLAKSEMFYSNDGVCPGFDPAVAAKDQARPTSGE